nr:hypothetical protein [Providencia rettgeri]
MANLTSISDYTNNGSGRVLAHIKRRKNSEFVPIHSTSADNGVATPHAIHDTFHRWIFGVI